LTAPIAFLADPALAQVWDALPDARVVGGAVRDAMLGLPVQDIDLATPQTPEAIVAALERAGLRAIPTGIAHGTVTALADHRGFEVTALRRDVATDGRHATVAFTDDWLADAARRDFTINAMSMDRSGRLYDPFDGNADLAGGKVRFVGDPRQRIAEDFLRVLRYFRFLARYGREPPDPATRAALAEAVPGLCRLSAERVWSELKRILAAPDPLEALRLMQFLGILDAVLPKATDFARLERLLHPSHPGPPEGAEESPLLRLAALLPALPQNFAERLRLSGAEAERLAALLAETPPLPEPASDDDIRRALADVDREVLVDRVRLAGGSPDLLRRVQAMPQPKFPLQGRDLVASGMPPGPEIGRLLARLRDWWLQGGCVATAEELHHELARRRVA
jgi:poly(A) polymerase